MPAVQRTVRHLRVKAPRAEQARRLLPVLDDALRCASLGDAEGTRLLVVRRLALGPVAAGISAQALSQRIEERLAEATRHWVDARSAEAGDAACVAFAGALDARVQLALRRLRGAPCAAWYWPLAVPECAAPMGLAEQLQRMAWTIAGWPEARAALPAWAAALADAGHGPALARAVAPAQGAALLARATLQPPAAPGQAGPARAGAASPVPTAAALPAWLHALLQCAAGAGTAGAAASPAPGPLRAADLAGTAAHVAQQDAARAAPAAPSTQPAPLARPGPGGAPRRPPQASSGHGVRAGSDAAPARPDATLPAETEADTGLPAASAHDWRAPTTHGGLLFLLPVLARLDLPAWLGTEAPRFAALVLRAALLRLRAPPDDPAWWLAGTAAEAEAAPHRPAAGPHWPARLSRCPTRGAQAATWLAACRLWLRRAGGPVLAGLVQRPARLALTATHADLFFALDQADLAVRRLGLDIDPGWLPWFGRVVGFHYGGPGA